jgi:hypothetical protein
VTGGWVERPVDWRQDDDRRCALCGRLLLGRVWLGADGRAYCEPVCEQVHAEYYLPRYG